MLRMFAAEIISPPQAGVGLDLPETRGWGRGGTALNGDDGEGEAGKLAQDETHPKLKDYFIEKHCTRHNEPTH